MVKLRGPLLVLAVLLAATACSGAHVAPPGSEAQGSSSAATPDPAPVSPSPAVVAEASTQNIAACRDGATLAAEHTSMLDRAVDGGGFLMSTQQAQALKLQSAHAAAVGPDGDVAAEVGAVNDVIREGLRPSGTQGFIDPGSAQALLDAMARLTDACAALPGLDAAALRPVTAEAHADEACLQFYKASGGQGFGSLETQTAFAAAVDSAMKAAAGDARWALLPSSIEAVARGYSEDPSVDELDQSLAAVDVTSSLCDTTDVFSE